MTILAERPSQEEDDSKDEGKPAVRRPAELGRRVLSVAFVALVVALVAVFAVEDPVAHAWYVARQQHLAAQFSKPQRVQVGDALSVLQIPAQGVNLTVLEGDGPGLLRAGPGHRPGTPRPGDLGNSIVFGHRTGWGGPFTSLAKVVVGDNIFVQSKTANGPDYGAIFFRVSSVRTVSATDSRPFAPSDDYRLTLVTSASGGRRLVVVAVSGSVGHRAPPGPHTTAATGAVGPALTWPVAGLLAAAAALAVIAVLRRKRASRSLAVVAAPLVLGALLAAVLIGDALVRSPLG